jgi:hypothetical protein
MNTYNTQLVAQTNVANNRRASATPVTGQFLHKTVDIIKDSMGGVPNNHYTGELYKSDGFAIHVQLPSVTIVPAVALQAYTNVDITMSGGRPPYGLDKRTTPQTDMLNRERQYLEWFLVGRETVSDIKNLGNTSVAISPGDGIPRISIWRQPQDGVVTELTAADLYIRIVNSTQGLVTNTS